MDGAAGISCSGTCLSQPQFRFVNNGSGILNPYLTLATQYGWANYMFQTNQGPSFPAHQFLFGGTSAPSAADDAAGVFASENMSGTSKVAGCTAPAGTTVELITPNGGEDQKVYPCFEHQTMSDILPTGFTWRYYAPSAGSIWTAPNAIQHICESTGHGGTCAGQDWTNNVDLKPADVLTDIAACKLRSVSWVIPTGANSDHAHVNDGGGPSWVASIINAVGTQPKCADGETYWNNTVILVTWDDFGGWYDHVVPPPVPAIAPLNTSAYVYGFRVPLLVVSAYTPAGTVSNVMGLDFGAMLKFTEEIFNLGTIPPGDYADAWAVDDLGEFFQFSQPPRAFVRITAPVPPEVFLDPKRPVTDPDNE